MLKKIPANMTLFEGSRIDILSEQGGDGGKTRRIKLDLYSGDEVPGDFGGKVIVDLGGMRQRSEQTPILGNHDHDSIVGFAKKDGVVNNGESLKVDGVAIVSMPATKEIVDASDGGFLFQASMGFRIKKARFVGENEHEKVNGREFDGPGMVVDESLLLEASVVPLGRDSNTSSRVFGIVSDDYIEMEMTEMPKDKENGVEAVVKFAEEHAEAVSKWTEDGFASGMNEGVIKGKKSAVERFSALLKTYTDEHKFVCEQYASGATTEETAAAYTILLKAKLETKDEEIDKLRAAGTECQEGSEGVKFNAKDVSDKKTKPTLTYEERAKEMWDDDTDGCRGKFADVEGLTECMRYEASHPVGIGSPKMPE